MYKRQVYYNERQVSIYEARKGKTMSDKDFIIIDEKEKEEEKSTPDTAAEDKAEVVQTEEKKDEKKEDDYEKICFICHRPESVTGKMVDLPNNITVCPDCMQKSFDAMTNGSIDYSRLMNMPGALSIYPF